MCNRQRQNTVTRKEMTINRIYQENKPLLNALFTGFFYCIFCWSIDFDGGLKELCMTLMLFLPGLSFPLTTCYFKPANIKYPGRNRVIHLVLSVLIYQVCVWLFSAEARIQYITMLAGVLGSLLFLLATKYLLKKQITILTILYTSMLSGLSFLPYELIGRYGILMGLAVFIWTVINGITLNDEYRRAKHR